MWKKVFSAFIAIFPLISSANIVILGTRIIYPAEQKTVNVQLSNTSKSPSLVQAWIDNGDANIAPEKIKTPFVITPPISRVEAKKGQTLRITYTGEPLANDRESVFYLNVLDIPPKPSAKEQQNNPNFLQIAIRSRIKLFYRPSNLTMSMDEAYNKVQWHIESEKGKNILVVNNPSPYHITYSHITLKQNNKSATAKEADMVAPFSQARYVLSAPIKGKATVHWVVINDYGGTQQGTSQLF